MGLTNWRGAKPRKEDAVIAKNYLNEPELAALNNLVERYLVFAEGSCGGLGTSAFASVMFGGTLTRSEGSVSSTAIKLAARIIAPPLIGYLIAWSIRYRLISLFAFPLLSSWEPSMAWQRPVIYDASHFYYQALCRLGAFVFAFPVWLSLLARFLWVVPASHDPTLTRVKSRGVFVISCCLLFLCGSLLLWRFGFPTWEQFGYRPISGSKPYGRNMVGPDPQVLSIVVSGLTWAMIDWGLVLVLPIACFPFARGLLERRRFGWFVCCYFPVVLFAVRSRGAYVMVILAAFWAGCIGVSWWIRAKGQPRL